MIFSRIFFYLVLAFVGGIAFGSLIFVPQVFILGFFILGVTLVSVFLKKNTKVVVAGFCLILFSIGIYRYETLTPPENSLDYYRLRSISFRPYTHDREYMVGTAAGLKNKLRMSIDSSLSPPQSALLAGLLLGDTGGLSKDFKQKLNIAGVRHITAISGMNVTILGNMLIGLGLLLGLYRGQAFYFALACIVFFTIMVGAPPSAVRAAIMGGITLFSLKVGRLAQADRLLLFAAAAMLALNPLLLKFDVGFQLSFLATFGILKLYPYLREKLRRLPEFLEIRNTVAMTIPAVIFTAPVLLSNFGQFSLVGFFTNILIIPVLAFIMGFGLLGALSGALFHPLGQIVLWPVWLFLTYVYKVVDVSAHVPFASVQISGFPWYLTVSYFALLWWGMKHFKVER